MESPGTTSISQHSDFEIQAETLPLEISRLLRSLDNMTPSARFDIVQKSILHLQGQLNSHKAAKDKIQLQYAELERVCRNQEQTIVQAHHDLSVLQRRFDMKSEHLKDEKARSQSLHAQLEELSRRHADLQMSELLLKQQFKRGREEAVELQRKLALSARAVEEAARTAAAQTERITCLENALRAAAERHDEDQRCTALLRSELANTRLAQQYEAAAARRTRQLVLDSLSAAAAAVPDHFLPFGPPLVDGYFERSAHPLAASTPAPSETAEAGKVLHPAESHRGGVDRGGRDDGGRHDGGKAAAATAAAMSFEIVGRLDSSDRSNSLRTLPVRLAGGGRGGVGLPRLASSAAATVGLPRLASSAV